MSKRNLVMKAAPAKVQKISIAVVESDPLRFIGLRSLFDSESDLELTTASLVELADRKLISLAQYKTNRDYLRSIREIKDLHRNVEILTNNFEQHWYGLVPADENTWAAFRSGYKEAITSA